MPQQALGWVIHLTKQPLCSLLAWGMTVLNFWIDLDLYLTLTYCVIEQPLPRFGFIWWEPLLFRVQRLWCLLASFAPIFCWIIVISEQFESTELKDLLCFDHLLFKKRPKSGYRMNVHIFIQSHCTETVVLFSLCFLHTLYLIRMQGKKCSDIHIIKTKSF